MLLITIGSRKGSGGNGPKVGSIVSSNSTPQLPPPSSSSSSANKSIPRHDTLYRVKEAATSDSTTGYTRPSFARNVSIQSEDNYYDDDFEEYNPDNDAALHEEVTDDEDEEEQKHFFSHDSNEATQNRQSSLDYRIKSSESVHSESKTARFPDDYYHPGAKVQNQKNVNSSASHDEFPPTSRNYYSSNSHDPQHNSSLDSMEHDNRIVSTASAISAAAMSRIGTADNVQHSQQPKKRQKNPTWISRRQWRLGEKIGSGSFGEVFQAMNDKGKLFAAKRMNVIDKSLEVDNLLGEIQLMRGLSHKHIVEYLGAFVDTDACYLYIFQEWVPGGSVAHLLKKFGAFSPSVVKNYTRQILLGLQYLHSNGIIHRDIKGGNILVDDGGVVKLADFGASTKLSAFDKTQETTTIKGTPYFMAPEVLAASRYGRKGDIWAVGCTMIQMLTGEPPWKDRNLKGLIQLHLLLSSWSAGPPPYSCELSQDGRQCLEMCFRKDENERPSANELLQCAFLRDDDLEDSNNSSFNNTSRSGINSALPSQRDLLEDSGVLTGLKLEINKAVTRSMAGLPPYQQSAVEDTLQMIDRKIAEKQQPSQVQNPISSNPFATRPSGDATHRSTESIQQLLDKLPSGNNYNGIAGPKFSKDVPIPTPLSLQQVTGSANNSTGNTPYSNNPYKKGNVAIKNNVPQAGNPFARDSGANNYSNSASSRSDDDNRPIVAGFASPTANFIPPVTTPMQIRGDNASAVQAPVRDSLQMIKRKANEKAHGISSIHQNRRLSSSSNQSSNRDTEELTPLPNEDETLRPADRHFEDEIHIQKTFPESQQRDEAKQSFYNTKYYEEKQRDYQLRTTNAAASSHTPRTAAISPSLHLDDTKEEYSSFSSNSNNNVSKRSVLEREVSVESVADEIGENYYSRDINSSNDDIPIRGSKNPFSSNNVEEIKVMSSIKTSQSVDSTGRKYYHSNKHEDGQDPSRIKPNIHQAILMKKSASAGDGVKNTSARSSPVPRLTALDKPVSEGAGSSAVSRAVDQMRRNSDKYSSSESARIVRPDPVVDSVTRPASSKASFLYQEKAQGSKNVSTASSPVTQSNLGTNVESRQTLGSLSGGGSANKLVSPQLNSDGGRGAWRCGKCGFNNVPKIDYCERCSIRRGVSGDRKVESVVPRF